jgi:hypothetical protein
MQCVINEQVSCICIEYNRRAAQVAGRCIIAGTLTKRASNDGVVHGVMLAWA